MPHALKISRSRMLALACILPCAGALHIRQPERVSFFNASDSNVKIIFFAGVEGSGHHLLESITPHIRICPLNFAPGTWGCGGEWQRTGFEIFVSQLKQLEGSCIHMLPQQMSYPMCEDGGHEGRMTYDYPRLDWIHEAVQQVGGIQLHVVQLYRDMGDCLAADCLHRTFEPCEQQAQTLISNGAKLSGHLKLLDPRDRSCFSYGEPQAMVNAVEETFGAEYGDLVTDIYSEHPAQGLRDQVPKWAEYVSMMQDVQSSLYDECRKSAPASLKTLSGFLNAWGSGGVRRGSFALP